MKRVLRTLLFLVLLALAAVAGFFFIDLDDEQYALLDFVPNDFVYLIESDEPVDDWQELSDSEVWQTLKHNEFFADITDDADYLDSLLASNELVVDLVQLGNMVISAHMTSAQDYEFIILVDLLGKGRKAAKVKPVLTNLLESFDYRVSTENYVNNTIYRLYDPVYDETMALAIVGNVMIFSYEESLVKQAILQNGQPSIRLNPDFIAMKDVADAGELYSIYLNYHTLPRLIGAYTPEMPDMLSGLDEILTYSVWDLSIDDESVEMDGYVRQNDSVPSYLTVFGQVGQGKWGAAEVLPQETAMLTSMGFGDFRELYRALTAQMQRETPADYEELEKRKGQVERLLKVSVEDDLFAWMTEEVVTAVVPMGQDYSYFAMLHFDDYDFVKDRLDYVTRRIGRTAVRFEELDYRGFPIRYLELKGFFKLFFQKLFDEIEQPHYTYLDDYVVFSNDTSSLQLLIDRYLDGQTLNRSAGFADFEAEFEPRSNIFTYLQSSSFYGYMSNLLDYEARRDLQKNKADFLAFPHLGFQLYPSRNMYRTKLYASFVGASEAGS